MGMKMQFWLGNLLKEGHLWKNMTMPQNIKRELCQILSLVVPLPSPIHSPPPASLLEFEAFFQVFCSKRHMDEI